MMPPLTALLGMLLAGESPHYSPNKANSRWRRRTANRRERTEQLLNRIEASGNRPPPLLLDPTQHHHNNHRLLADYDVPTLWNPSIDWDQNEYYHQLDPIRGGKIRPDTQRGARKRAQVEAFAHVVSQLLHTKKIRQASSSSSSPESSRVGTTIIDAGSGAGNLAIPLAGLLLNNMEGSLLDEGEQEDPIVEIMAVDVNEIALSRLAERVEKMPSGSTIPIRTLVADLADTEHIMGMIPLDRDVIVVSLHACGAASDYAMNLAYQRDGAPFAICPCCTAKSLTKRGDYSSKGNNGNNDEESNYNLNASFKRSGATNDIIYPRSMWLRNIISLDTTTTVDTKDEVEDDDGYYSILAKVADVGLGPQTPSQQREHQRRAKKIIELDRLASSSENHGYETRLLRIQHHDPLVYGKGELLLGAKRGSIAADVFGSLVTATDKTQG
ncbi:hypothetical protein ACHAXR_002142 [Thalassiosira sp. AJA248-18]